ncbi:MAG: Fur family ferric uptake transcriptional regulator [Bradymonadia bacterium]|jgi:Fur family ferric uptake transcriptional regulator
MTRRTEQRDAIATLLQTTERPLSAAEVHEHALVSVPAIGIATVYRELKRLVAAGEIVSVDLPGEPSRFERADHDHHHHFRCDECARVFDVPGCSGTIDTHAPDGFVVTRHEVVLYGTCAECN